MDYSGTPLETEYDRIKRRREVFKAMQDRAMQQHQNEIVGGQVVKYSPWEGMAQLGSSYLAAKGQQGADKQEEALGNKYRQGVAEAIQRVQGIKEGQNYGPQGPMIPQPNPEKAQLEAAADPFLSSNAPVQAALLSQSKAAIDAKSNPSFQFMSTPQGIIRGNRRTGDMDLPEDPFMIAKDDIEHQKKMAYGKQLGTGAGEAATDPVTEYLTTQAHENVLAGSVPAREEDTARRKAQVELETAGKIKSSILRSESEEKRAQSAVGINDLTTEAKAIFNGEVPPTASGIGVMVDWLGGQFGVSPAGASEAAQLKAIGGALVGHVPRFEGQQSDKDVMLYREMAGQIGDPTLPIPTRLASLRTVEKIWGQYERTKTAKPPSEYKSVGIPEGWSEEEWNVLTDEERKSLQ